MGALPAVRAPASPLRRSLWTGAEYLRTRYRGFATRDALLTWQLARVERHLRELGRISPMIAERGPVEGWRSWPVVDREWALAHFDRWNTAGLTAAACEQVALAAEADPSVRPVIGACTVALTPGAGGRRGLSVVSDEEQARWAGRLLGHLVGEWWREHRIAFFLRARGNLHHAEQGWRLKFEWYDLLDPPEVHLARLARQRPSVLVAPPSMLRFLAEELPPRAIDPATVVSVAEVLDPIDQRVIEGRFGPVRQVYQAAEGYLGQTCALGRLHLVEDSVLVEREPVDDRRFVPILTHLWRRTLPIVRYRLDDVLVAGDCACGSPHQAIAAIEGRAGEVLQLPGRGGTVRVFPGQVRQAIQGVPGVLRYQVHQVGPDRIEVGLAVEGERALGVRRVERELERLWARVEAVPPRLVFADLTERPSAIPLSRVTRRF